MLMALIGCSGSESVTDPVETSEDPNTEPSTFTEPAETRPGGVRGLVTDTSGQGVAEGKLTFCVPLGLCTNATTEADGTFEILNAGDNTYAFEVSGKDDVLATTVIPLTVTGAMLMQDITLPALDPSSPMPAQPEEVEMGEGMFLTIGVNELTPPLFVPSATEVAGVRVPEEIWVPGPENETVLAQWHLSPYNHKSANGLPLRVANDIGAADGEVFQVWVSDYDSGTWLSGGTLTASGGWLEGGSLPVVSTVVITP